MTHDEMERAIAFLIDHQAHSRSDLDSLAGLVAGLGSEVRTLTEDVRLLTADLRGMGQDARSVTEDVRILTEDVHLITQEMRDGFNNLIVANEVTRDLASQAAKLAVAVSQRVTKLEES